MTTNNKNNETQYNYHRKLHINTKIFLVFKNTEKNH